MSPGGSGEVARGSLDGPNKERFGNTSFQVSMNQARWASLPADVQKAFSDVSGEAWTREVGEIWTKVETGGLALALKAGNKHIQLSEAELDAFRSKLEPVVQRWIDEVKGKGIDGAALVRNARELVAKYSK